eukprot:2341724-Rhodomonas_salina.1
MLFEKGFAVVFAWRVESVACKFRVAHEEEFGMRPNSGYRKIQQRLALWEDLDVQSSIFAPRDFFYHASAA